jgi:leucyl/phenylalanyl-tRNA--protein transferase
MPIVVLGKNHSFHPIDENSPKGVVAIGGDLSSKRLLDAYSKGIFPWYSEGGPILWWSPDPRLVLFPDELHISKSMKRLKNKNTFKVTFDRRFVEVIHRCSLPRKGISGTWITDEMSQAYQGLHDLGYAHSIEVWQGNSIVGGLYGISLGRCFFAESMFFRKSNASKYAFISLAEKLKLMDFIMMDCQVTTEHVMTLGAREISRKMFLSLLEKSMNQATLIGSWSFLEDYK